MDEREIRAYIDEFRVWMGRVDMDGVEREKAAVARHQELMRHQEKLAGSVVAAIEKAAGDIVNALQRLGR